MSNDSFTFKKFTIHQDKCAMKVGTDGVLLGALAEGGSNILDIGTGTGLVAIMMAQRFPVARITAIDIDNDACNQAIANASESPYASQIEVVNMSLLDFVKANYTARFDSIVCNPPYFENSLTCPDAKRSLARHNMAFSYSQLLYCAEELLTDEGTMTVIMPTDSVQGIASECADYRLHIIKRSDIKTTERKMPKRAIIVISRHKAESYCTETVCLTENGMRSKWFQNVTDEFYL